MRLRHLALACSAIALPSAALAEDEPPLAEACPDLTPAQVEEIETFSGPFRETAIYARSYCVSIAEAERRFEIQLRGATGPREEPGPRPAPAPDADAGTLQAVLHTQESDTFAGLWIQHEPVYGIMVAFTKDAAETLARYTSDPLYIPVERPGPTLTQLRETQDRLVEDLTRLGFAWHGAGSDIVKGTVDIDLAQEAAPIRAAAARGELDLPSYVVLKEPPAFPLPAPPIPAGDRRLAGFPQFPARTDGGIRTLVGVPDVPARLELRDGCLWLYPDGEEGRIAVWEQHMAPDLTDPDRIAVMDRISGAKVYAGTRVVLSGLQPGEVRPPDTVIGNTGCPGPYRVVRGIQPYAAWAAARREAAIARRQHELGSRAAAIADYEADMARIEALAAWRDEVMMERGDVVAEIHIDREQGTAHVFHTIATSREGLAPAALLPFVTAQTVPQGANALAAAQDAVQRELEDAGVSAQVSIDALQGYVAVRPDDLAALSEAGDGIAWPALVRIEPEWVGPLFDPDVAARRADPDAVWYRLEQHPDFAAIRAIVERTPLRRPAPPLPGTHADRWETVLPSRAGSLQQTHFLIAYGFDLAAIEDLTRAGYEPVTAVEYMNGQQTAERRALIATNIVIAEPVAIDRDDPGGDGYFSTVTWRVVENLKGDLLHGAEIRQRMASGKRADETGAIAYRQGQDEPFLLPGLPQSLEPGSRWVLHLNDALYRHMAFVNGGEGAARSDGTYYVATPWSSPAAIGKDGIARPVGFGQEAYAVRDLEETTLEMQRAFRVMGHPVR